MIANYYTLRCLARDLDRRIKGFVIDEVFTQQRNELVLSARADRSNAEEIFHLLVLCEPAQNAFYGRSTFHRAKKNSVNMFETMIGARLREVSIHPFDRAVTLVTDRPVRLIVQMFGSKANVLMVDATSAVVDAFLRKKELLGTQLHEDAPSVQRERTEESLFKAFHDANDPLVTVMKRLFPLLGTTLVHEIMHRSGISVESQSNSVTERECKRLYEQTRVVIGELEQSCAPRIYDDQTEPAVFSVVPLRHQEHRPCRSFESIHDAVRTFLGASRKQRHLHEESHHLHRALVQQRERTQRTLAKQASEEVTTDRAKVYETTGKLLMANISTVTKGMKRVVVENVFDTAGGSITIELLPGLTPAQNAERYFEKAKKARRSRDEHERRTAEMDKRLELLNMLLEQLESVKSKEELEQFQRLRREELMYIGINVDPERSTQREIPFRLFIVVGGFQVWAGKSSENNDLLTMKYAKPNDLWFHARGSSGSHVVLKLGTGNGAPSKAAIEQAASIAAYYSKMKRANLVAVAMTERKYVRKPKGAPVGTVRLERETTLLVPPKLPEP